MNEHDNMRFLSRLLTLLSAALLMATPAVAQTSYTTNITLQNLLAGGVPVPSAQVCATAVDVYGNPISFSAPGWGLVLKGVPFCRTATNGALPNGLPVPDANHTNSPVPIYYNFSIQILVAGVPSGAPVTFTAVPNVTTATYPLDSYTPTTTTVTPAANVVGSGIGVPGSCASPSIWLETATSVAYTCHAGAYIPLANGATTHAFNVRGAWQPNTSYNAFDVVTSSGSAYSVTTAFTSGSTFSTSNLVAITTGLSARGAWAAGTPYSLNDLASYNGSTYVRTVPGTTSSSPDTDTINWTLLAAAATSQSAVNAAVNTALTPTSITTAQGNMGTTSVNTTASGPKCYFNYVPLTVSGTVSSFQMDVGAFAPGDQLALVTWTAASASAFPPSNVLFTTASITSVPIKSVGVNTWTAGTDYTAPTVTAGQYIGQCFLSSTTTVNYGTDGAYGPGILTFPATNPLVAGTVFQTGSFASNYMHVLVNVSYISPGAAQATVSSLVAVATAPLQSAVTAATTAATAAQATANTTASSLATYQPSQRNRTLLWSESFAGSALPANWAQVDNYNSSDLWTVNNGLVSPSTPIGYTSVIDFNQYYAVDQRTTRVTFQLLTSGAIVGAGYNDWNSDNIDGRGTLFVVDSTNNVLTVSTAGGWPHGYPTTPAPAVAASTPITFPLTTGVSYVLSMQQNHGINSATLSDPVTGSSVNVSYGDNTNVSQISQQVDFPAFVGISGQFKIMGLSILANDRKPHIMLLGNSRDYGYNQAPPTTWAYMLQQSFPAGAVLISGRPGATSVSLLARVQSEAAYLKPDVCYLESGANDAFFSTGAFTSNGTPVSTGVAVFVANMQAAINACKAFGAKVIVDVLPPDPSYYSAAAFAAYHAATLALTGVDGNLRSDLALTINNDGVTYNPADYGGDNIHYNTAGATAVRNRWNIDAPWVFD